VTNKGLLYVKDSTKTTKVTLLVDKNLRMHLYSEVSLPYNDCWITQTLHAMTMNKKCVTTLA